MSRISLPLRITVYLHFLIFFKAFATICNYHAYRFRETLSCYCCTLNGTSRALYLLKSWSTWVMLTEQLYHHTGERLQIMHCISNFSVYIYVMCLHLHHPDWALQLKSCRSISFAFSIDIFWHPFPYRVSSSCRPSLVTVVYWKSSLILKFFFYLRVDAIPGKKNFYECMDWNIFRWTNTLYFCSQKTQLSNGWCTLIWSWCLWVLIMVLFI